jgi:hypothetical protein
VSTTSIIRAMKHLYFNETTWCYIPERCYLHPRPLENLTSLICRYKPDSSGSGYSDMQDSCIVNTIMNLRIGLNKLWIFSWPSERLELLATKNLVWSMELVSVPHMLPVASQATAKRCARREQNTGSAIFIFLNARCSRPEAILKYLYHYELHSLFQ